MSALERVAVVASVVVMLAVAASLFAVTYRVMVAGGERLVVPAPGGAYYVTGTDLRAVFVPQRVIDLQGTPVDLELEE